MPTNCVVRVAGGQGGCCVTGPVPGWAPAAGSQVFDYSATGALGSRSPRSEVEVTTPHAVVSRGRAHSVDALPPFSGLPHHPRSSPPPAKVTSGGVCASGAHDVHAQGPSPTPPSSGGTTIQRPSSPPPLAPPPAKVTPIPIHARACEGTPPPMALPQSYFAPVLTARSGGLRLSPRRSLRPSPPPPLVPLPASSTR